ncbi:hypothetical protein S40293_05044 [Stachybotrys chartarum IBT 40293]|nr:hypothetical protein S40293_05044 [Stachybotrys chartarum IBT 40293]
MEPRRREDYTVAWICPLEVEQIAALQMLEEQHSRLPQPGSDHNVYNLGAIAGHNVVIAGLPQTGNNSAAAVVTQLRMTFPNVKFGLLVGIGGGVPVTTDAGMVRLGDVVVSKPTGIHSGAVQYDHGKAWGGKFERTGSLAPPPALLLSAAQDMAAKRAIERDDPIESSLLRIDTSIRTLRRFKRPGAAQDHLYRPSYIHLQRGQSCDECGCDVTQRIPRPADDDGTPYITVHRGTVASGELVLKDAFLRDQLASSGVLCFDMEAAGALTDFPCLVIRGISDYCDTHKNDIWQGFAAAAAAAYARQLFFHMPIDEVRQREPVGFAAYSPSPTPTSSGSHSSSPYLTSTPRSAPPLPPRFVAQKPQSAPPDPLPSASARITGMMYSPTGTDARSRQVADHKNAGRWDQALFLEQQAFEDLQKRHGAEHLATLTAATDLSITTWTLGYLQGASQWADWVTQIATVTLGAKHPLLLKLGRVKGEIHLVRGQNEEAEALLGGLLVDQQDILGVDHPDALDTMESLAQSHKALGRMTEAEERLRRRADALSSTLGQNHIKFASALVDLVLGVIPHPSADELSTRQSQGSSMLLRFSELISDLHHRLEESFGPRNQVTIRALRACGTLKLLQGKTTEASDMLRRALSYSEDALGPDFPETLLIVSTIGIMYGKKDGGAFSCTNSAGFRPWLERYVDWLERRMGNIPETQATLSLLGMSYMDDAKYVEAERFWGRAVKSYEGSSSANAQTALSMYQLCQANTSLYRQRTGTSELVDFLGRLGLNNRR